MLDRRTSKARPLAVVGGVSDDRVGGPAAPPAAWLAEAIAAAGVEHCKPSPCAAGRA